MFTFTRSKFNPHVHTPCLSSAVGITSAFCIVGSRFSTNAPAFSVTAPEAAALTMKLLTHNILMCNVKGVKNGYPLKVEATKFEEREVDFNPDFLRNRFDKIDWAALRQAAESVSGCSDRASKALYHSFLRSPFLRFSVCATVRRTKSSVRCFLRPLITVIFLFSVRYPSAAADNRFAGAS